MLAPIRHWQWCSTGDVLAISVVKKQLVSQGPPKGQTPRCGVQAIAIVHDHLLIGSGDGELMVMDKLTFQPRMVQSVLGGVTSIAMDSAGSETEEFDSQNDSRSLRC